MTRLVVTFTLFAAMTSVAAGPAGASGRDMNERFDRPPTTLPGGDIAYGPFVFPRARNPNGSLRSIRDGMNQSRALRLTVAPGLLREARLDAPGLADRAELREVRSRRLAYGTPVWYGFAMRLPTDFPSGETRFVLAQVKTPATRIPEPSPVFALRHEFGGAYATLEYERGEDDDSLVPRDAEGRCPAGSAPAYPHADNQVRIALTPPPPARARRFSACSRAVSIETFGDLAMPLGRWIDFVVYLRPAPGGDGRIELRVDGRLVMVATGRIGVNAAGGEQFFKIGPYRDRDAVAAAIDVDDLRRGFSLEAVARPRGLGPRAALVRRPSP